MTKLLLSIWNMISMYVCKVPYLGSILPVHHIWLAVPESKHGEEDLPEHSVLPAVDQDVDAGVEHQEGVGDLYEQITPWEE